MELPDGVHQVILEGRRGPTGTSGVAIDDVRIMPCEDFTSECISRNFRLVANIV